MFFAYLGRTFKLGFQNFFRNFWLSLVTVLVLLLTLFSITLLATLNIVGNEAIKLVKEKVDMELYFEVGIEEEQVLAAKNYIERNDKVKEVIYVSAEQALENFKEAYKDNAAITQSLEELEENPLPASLVIKAADLEYYQDIISYIDTSEYANLIEAKDYQDNQLVINRINSATDRIYQIGFAVSGVFAVISLLVVFNTFRIAIYAHREELSIMKLVGATNSFVRAPFLFESFIYAIVTTVVTMAIFYPAMIGLSPYINEFFTGYDFDLIVVFQQYFWSILGLQFLCALIISALSSIIAIGRYLRV